MQRITVAEMLLRLALAFAAGLIVGWDRESHGRPAGLRTNILVCVASAVAMMVSEMVLVETAGSPAAGAARADPARLGAGILTGIGFLGAGTILRHENFVRGVTTAASLWFLTVLGLAFGSGFFALGAMGLALALITLYLLPRLERWIPSDWYVRLTITLQPGELDEDDLRRKIQALGTTVLATKIRYDVAASEKTLSYDLRLSRSDRFEIGARLVTAISQFPGVRQVGWE